MGVNYGAVETVQPLVMYTQPGCASCETAEAWLEEHGITVTVLDIRSDYQILYEFLDTGSRTTPTLVWRDQTREGFDPEKWMSALLEWGFARETG